MTQQAMVLSADAEKKIDKATAEINSAQAAIEGLADLLMTMEQVGDDDSVNPRYREALAFRKLDVIRAIELSTQAISASVFTIEQALLGAKGAAT